MSNEYYNDDDGGEGGGGFNLDPLEPGFGEQFARFLAQRDEYLLGRSPSSSAACTGRRCRPSTPTRQGRSRSSAGCASRGVDDAKALQVYQRSTELFDATPRSTATDELADASLAVAIEEARTLAQAEANADGVLGKLRGEFGDLDREQLLDGPPSCSASGRPVIAARRLAMRDAAAEQSRPSRRRQRARARGPLGVRPRRRGRAGPARVRASTGRVCRSSKATSSRSLASSSPPMRQRKGSEER